jgi:hypothetical protein
MCLSLTLNAQVCTISCANSFSNSDGSTTIVGYAYAWSQPDGTTCQRPQNGNVSYAIAMGGPGKRTVIIDQGVTQSFTMSC